MDEFIKKVKEVKHDVKVFFMPAYLSDDIQFRTELSFHDNRCMSVV